MTITARPTTHRGVRMRSRLEAGFAAWLDRAGFVWEYEPTCFSGSSGQYLPDFKLSEVEVCGVEIAGKWHHSGQKTVYVEVKPPMPALEETYLERISAAVHESEPDSLLVIATPPPDGAPPTDPSRLLGVLQPGLVTLPLRWYRRQGEHPKPRYSIGLPPIPAGIGPWWGEWWRRT